METGYVVGLDLRYSLHGPFRSNSSLFRLLHVRNLNLAHNNFSSCPIPSEFGQLSRLTHLDLSYSMFSGRIPSEISRLTNLISLDLSYYSGMYFSFDTYPTKQEPELLRRLSQNLTSLGQLHLSGLNLSSQVPESLANLSSLTHLSLDRCGLIGEFPKRIFQLPNIQVVDLSYNEDLTGSLPEFYSGSNLTSLALENAKFVGKIPNSIGNLKSLDELVLQSCMFSGPVPYSIGNLSQLSYLSLSFNFFNGQLPSTLGNLAKIQELELGRNEFSGEFPSSLGNLPQLENLYLYQNNFRSHVPSSLANFTKLCRLDLSDNFFHGSLPISLPYLLEDIDFRNNSLTGSIPSHTFDNLTSLKCLHLSSNSLNGVIPSSLLTLPSFRELHLDDNQFIGLEVLSNSSFLETLSLSGNRLNGNIPSSIAKFILLRELYLSSNNLSGRVDFKIFSCMLKTLDLSYNSLSLTTNVSLNISALPMFDRLFLSSCNITEFPVFLKAQNDLAILDLSNNRIGGLIPKWFLSMNLGWLSLSHNFIAGWEEVPLIHQWKGLRHLDLNSNMLQGPLLVPPISTVSFLISNNSLTGQIDPLFCKLRDLQALDASNNHLDGTIPQCLENLDGSLRVLNLRRNSFHGNIPQICRDKSTLMTLDLSHNQLYGNIPRWLVKCKNLDVLNLGGNQLSDTFPFWLQDLQRLQVLVLSSNKFHGPICCPRDFFGFMTLKTIDLSHNDFTGKLPLEYFRNWTSMSSKVSKMGFESRSAYNEKGIYNDSVKIIFKGQEMELVKTLTVFISIDLSNNKFDGEIPSTLWRLRSLVMLNLSSNNFRGPIPSSLGNLKELESLDLSNNKLFGKIPQQLTALTFLAYLNLSHNQLAGQLPQGGQVSTFQDSSFEGNLGLCGIPLSRKCETPPLPASNDDYNNEKSDSIFGFGWKAVVVGYGCGLLIGMVAGHVITSRRPDLISRIFRVRLQR
ncbi:receptor-like protein 33 [Ziziphus jujuba]|uniref:Receptor-like protein 33 n=1 Tax=Ziziphus jujuba TaxID=326968 RepID=A0ABM3ZRZ9_ZIZJJ|nr:receptor-like protein 33 [Ziziphus jujuba]